MEPQGSIQSLFSGGPNVAKRILVVGRNTFDSGKTTFAGVLARELMESSVKVEYFKPISAHNYSEKFAHTKECVTEERLYSYDLATISKILESSLDKYIANPVHRLYVPTKLDSVKSSHALEEKIGTLGLAGLDAVIAMERLSHPEKRGIDSMTLISSKLIEDDLLLITKNEVESLSKGTKTHEIESLERLQEIESQKIEKYLTSAMRNIETRAELVLIESFNDSVWPWVGLESVDVVAVVSRGQAALYDPSRFRKAAFLKKRNTLPIREVDFNRIAEFVKPQKNIEWHRNEKNKLMEALGIDF
jgi:predicted P-loop ATPase/GTPase